jgi:NAD(P)-dependent dehydrogenase (short-subunit alcohol dehydrogenase family)
MRLAEAGAAVLITDVRDTPREGGVSTHELIESDGGRAAFVAADVADAHAMDSAVAAAVERFGGLQIIVCAAGVVPPDGDSRTIDVADFERHLAINVTGSFLAARAALRHFAEHRYGRVIMVSSTSGLVGVARTAAYCASKAAVIGLARALAVEFGPLGITVNALCPGAIYTAMGEAYRAAPEVLAALRDMTPLRLPGSASFIAEPRDIANAVLFIASEDARFMTGACLSVDGGLTTA